MPTGTGLNNISSHEAKNRSLDSPAAAAAVRCRKTTGTAAPALTASRGSPQPCVRPSSGVRRSSTTSLQGNALGRASRPSAYLCPARLQYGQARSPGSWDLRPPSVSRRLGAQPLRPAHGLRVPRLSRRTMRAGDDSAHWWKGGVPPLRSSPSWQAPRQSVQLSSRTGRGGGAVGTVDIARWTDHLLLRMIQSAALPRRRRASREGHRQAPDPRPRPAPGPGRRTAPAQRLAVPGLTSGRSARSSPTRFRVGEDRTGRPVSTLMPRTRSTGSRRGVRRAVPLHPDAPQCDVR